MLLSKQNNIINRLKENHLKKKLIMIAAFCLSMCVVSVKANESGDLFTTIGQSHLPGVTVAPFKTGDTTINVNLDPYGYVSTYVNGSKVKVPNVKHKVKCPTKDQVNYYPDCYEREWETSGNRADGEGNYKVQLEKTLAEGDKVTLSFADDGNFYFGQLTFESQKSQNERLQKEREAEEKQYAEELFKRSIEEETNKTWYQRWGDSIQDQWWNLKSWWQG